VSEIIYFGQPKIKALKRIVQPQEGKEQSRKTRPIQQKGGGGIKNPKKEFQDKTRIQGRNENNLRGGATGKHGGRAKDMSLEVTKRKRESSGRLMSNYRGTIGGNKTY